MFNSSPIESWDGAGVFYSFATSGVSFWFWVAVLCCIIPLIITLRTENHHEHIHRTGGADDTDRTAGVE